MGAKKICEIMKNYGKLERPRRLYYEPAHEALLMYEIFRVDSMFETFKVYGWIKSTGIQHMSFEEFDSRDSRLLVHTYIVVHSIESSIS